jgi:hypothetical protein
MQVIIPVGLSPSEYHARGQDLRWVHVPQPCPYCRIAHSFEVLGRYWRWITDHLTEVAYLIPIRRFRSRFCPVTISCLPDFCQPHRLVCNAAIGAYMAGERLTSAVLPWCRLLASYRRRFERWLNHERGFSATVGSRFGRPPPIQEARACWDQVILVCGGVGPATDRLVREFKITLFGRYRCHQSVRFASGK